MTHTWYPVSPRVVDFHHPGDGYYWLDWNAAPGNKPFYLLDPDKSSVEYGAPVYEHAKSLAATRYFPSPDETAFLQSFVRDNGGVPLFESAGWREKLFGALDNFRTNNPPPERYESAEERVERIRYELVESKRQIEGRLGVEVDYFIWPGGGYDDVSMKESENVYKAVTIRSSGRMGLCNRPSERPGRIVRRGIPGAELDGRVAYYGGRYMVEFVREFEGSVFARRKRQVMKLGLMAAARIGLWPRA
jgi:hypothetical protein